MRKGFNSKWLVYAKRADFKGIQERFGIDQVIARIMRNRDVITDEEIQMYLNGGLEVMYNPLLMKDLSKAVDIIIDKIRQNKKIRIIGDYDIDGVCSITILYKAFKRAGADVDYVVPHRIKDGYGINEHLIDNAYDEGVDTIVTCDNGIAAIEQINYGIDKGMTIIVTDHHDIPFSYDENENKIYKSSRANAIVDPKREIVNSTTEAPLILDEMTYDPKSCASSSWTMSSSPMEPFIPITIKANCNQLRVY